ncbi:2-succinyl-5-enolpyruvyl-6-hydroxy-3-cyclohexene-1-carboxylic-acid synthase [Protaetiibacter mangrovi]|uniref:2-succinyl-5-enolpyruvyl-6-hydroxy-3-cyclohexene-1-carboxylate synthase n=1 Tax=Protaetiibacter mangrovi TaxID=2970926 RepID=A0ABT1ZG84_9MICO|nr:2-succinyl-5-enolpyruvyl-6-hydroxy-3-cyclohexene-1-carboxylic-acid synthase [Protaetiibacter mangrovi]MCS0499727.1 2-succinyl-5-enolpyruvyl-6-hydroxy-3-cyclohexene-1-carboxylic-acid synthase [Protaetiibacter mangrovi]TPX04754.1 2-succinyl-5-enolpyruvyl-6-hydroxy-3-cyclohexene-1-carboxylic-acid synthase [Schumannella luteola]
MTPPAPDAPASVYATALLAGLVRRGVTDVVVCPGSRSQALALAAARFEQAGLLHLHVRIDERSAGFLALGLAAETGVPAVVVTTSGTAVGNLHPAVLEAAHSGVPLLVVSADRPEELRGVGANQTTRQAGIFRDVAPQSWDVPPPVGDAGEEDAADALAAELLDGIRGPRHVNLAFREPLSSPVRLPEIEPGEWVSAAVPAADTIELAPAPGTVVVAGTGAGEQAERIARELGAPLLAEVASGARFGPNLVAAYRELLGTAGFGDRVERVVVFGHPTLSREVPALIERRGVETVVVRTAGLDDYNPGRRVARFADELVVDTSREPDPSWPRRWVHASRTLLEVDDGSVASIGTDYAERAAFAREQLQRMRAPVTRRDLAEAVWAASWPHDRLVLGASRLIRELDRVAPGKRIPVHANRGLAGIDGTVATATGIALASQRDETRPGVTRVLFGDLALLHDVGSLLGGEGEEWPRLQLVVGNDHGGTIFDGLEVARSADPALADRVLLTPQHVDLAALASAYGWEHRLVTERGQLDGALTPTPGRVVVEVALAR